MHNQQERNMLMGGRKKYADHGGENTADGENTDGENPDGEKPNDERNIRTKNSKKINIPRVADEDKKRERRQLPWD